MSVKEAIIISVNRCAEALKKDPLTVIEMLGMGSGIEEPVWCFMEGLITPDDEFFAFIDYVAEHKGADVVKHPWYARHTGYFADLNSRIWGVMGAPNEWAIAPQKMQLKATTFGGLKYQPQTLDTMKAAVMDWLKKRSSYPERWVKHRDLLRGMQARYNSEELKTAVVALKADGVLWSRIDDEGRGRPGAEYAVKH